MKGFTHDSNFYNLQWNKSYLRMYMVSGAASFFLFFVNIPALLLAIQKWKSTFLCNICKINNRLLNSTNPNLTHYLLLDNTLLYANSNTKSFTEPIF